MPDQIDLVPPRGIGEVVIEDRLIGGAAGNLTGRTSVPSGRPVNTTASGPS